MRKLLLMLSCVAGVAYATENMDMSDMGSILISRKIVARS